MPKELIYQIADVDLISPGPSGRGHLIMVRGNTTTAGWSEPELRLQPLARAPLDGIYDYEFVATRPAGPVSQVVSPVGTRYVVEAPPAGFLGVRVSATTNARVALVERPVAGPRAVALRGRIMPAKGGCQILQTPDGTTWPLVGNLNGLAMGDDVYAAGIVADLSFCQEGRTLLLTWVSKDPPRF